MASADGSPVDRKKQLSKRSSNSYTSEEWRRHRPLITQLYFEEGRTLKDVAEYLKREYDFGPTYVLLSLSSGSVANKTPCQRADV
jgi:hypothetical protein